MSYSDTVATIAIIVSFIAIPASAYLSFKYAVQGERRKEWNALAEPLLSHFEQVSREAKQNLTYSTTTMPVEEFEKIQRRMGESERQNFRLLVENIIIIRGMPFNEERNEKLSDCAEKIRTLLKIK